MVQDYVVDRLVSYTSITTVLEVVLAVLDTRGIITLIFSKMNFVL